MRIGKEFEVTKDVYERAKEHGGYMAGSDERKHFSDAILCGYGLYNCRVREENGKYICSYMTGDSCD